MNPDKLKHDLAEAHVTQAALAEAVGLHESTVSRQLHGHIPLDPHVAETARRMIGDCRRREYLRAARTLMELAGHQ